MNIERSSQWAETMFAYEGLEFRFFHDNGEDHIFQAITNTETFYERRLLDALAPLISPGDLVLDVGANIGNHCIYFAAVCGARVIAYEPNPAALRILKKNVAANGLEHLIEIRAYALGNVIAQAVPNPKCASNLGATSLTLTDAGLISVNRLDDEDLSGTPKLLKIDVEGMDLAVIEGARSLLSDAQPIIAVEAEDRSNFDAIAKILHEIGYLYSGSYNYTPTHVFRIAAANSLGEIVRQVLSDEGRRYIDFSLQNRREHRDALAKQASLQASETRAGEIFASRPTQRPLSRPGEDSVRIIAELDPAIDLLRSSFARLSEQFDELSRKMSSIGVQVEEGIARLEQDVSASLQAQFDHAAWLDAQLSSIRGTLKSDLDRQISGLRGDVRSAIKDAQLTQSESAGTLFADIVVEMDRRVARRAAAVASRHREFFAHPGIDTREILPWAPLVSVLGAPGEGIDGAEELARFIVGNGSSIDVAAIGNARLEPHGLVRVERDDDSGIVTPVFDAACGGVLCVETDVVEMPNCGTLILQMYSDSGEELGPEFNLDLGVNRCRIFAPARTSQALIKVKARGLNNANHFCVRAINVTRFDLDEHQRRVSQNIGEPVLASLASIPSRRNMLPDCVMSLLAQCDRVRVFLNNYDEMPDILEHPRIEVRRSQDWDDRGDAGKFHWIDRDEKEGFRIIADDDLIFPPDFAEIMTARVADANYRAIYCTHGVLLRQPIHQYYSEDSRAATFHFKHALNEERTVHIGGTGGMCFHSSAISISYSEFRYCNSGDVWISRYAQEHGLPVISVARPKGWIRENKHESPEDTIYNHSHKRTRSRFDSSLVQDAVIRHSWPLTIGPSGRPKLCILFVAKDSARLTAAVNSWLSVRSLDVDWVVMIASSDARSSVRDMASHIKIEHEVHLIDKGKSLADRIAQARELALLIGADAQLTILDAVRFNGAGWEALAFSQPKNCGIEWVLVPDGKSENLAARSRCDEDKTVTARVELFHPISVRFEHGKDASLTLDPSSTPTRRNLFPAPVADKPPTPLSLAAGRTHWQQAKSINDFFERVLVLNLDRRPDRWEEMQWQLGRAGIKAERFSAIDGSSPEISAEYKQYATKPLVAHPAFQDRLTSGLDFYIRPPSQVARVAQLEQSSGRKAIASAGAWGYLCSYRNILEQALADQVETLLVLDDDAIFHEDIRAKFAEVAKELPQDWLIVQLGTLQYNWNEPWHVPVSKHLYRTNGCAIGSHALGLRFEAIPSILDHLNRMDMPFDIGALSSVTQAFPERCFVTLPNLAIQRLGRQSDINTSEYQKSATMKEAAATYRWELKDYPDVSNAFDDPRRKRIAG